MKKQTAGAVVVLALGFMVAMNPGTTLAQSPQLGENFFSLQKADEPPLPYNPFPDLPLYSLGAGIFLYDDSSVDYVSLRESAQSESEPPLPGEGESTGTGEITYGSGPLFESACTVGLLPPVHQVTNLILTVSGAATNGVYDLFTVSNLNVAIWQWLQRGTNGQSVFVITNPPVSESYYFAGCADADADGDGLTDAYEVLVSRTDRNDPDTDYDGRSDYEELANDGTDPLNAGSFTPVRLGYFRFNTTNGLGERGETPLVATNLQSVDAWITKGVQLTNAAALLKYRTVETDGVANINLRSGTVRCWFKPLWNSGTGPGAAGKLLEVGSKGAGTTNGWWSLYVNPEGETIYFVSQTNNTAEVTNLTASVSFTSNRWCQIVLTYTNGAVALYTNGVLCASNSASLPYPPLTTRTSGFTIGSDTAGESQAKGVFEDLETFNYLLNTSDIVENYVLTRPPNLIPDLQQWLLAAYVHTNPPGLIDIWYDQSGNTNDATANGAGKPAWITNALNGHEIVRFDTDDYIRTVFPSSITNWAAAEAYIVLRAEADASANNHGLWNFGPTSSYPNQQGEVLDSFASASGQRNVGGISQGLTNFHLYNVLSRAGEWTARFNGVVKFTSGTNVVSLGTTINIGVNNAYYRGDIAELLLFNRALYSGEREGLSRYLNERYQLQAATPQTPTNLTANVLSPKQVSLWWNVGSNNEQTAYTVEKSTNGIDYVKIARVEGASLIDSGLATNTLYFYRVKAVNLAGESGYFGPVSVTTLTTGSDMPLDAGTLKLWLKADDGALVNHDGTLDCWLDRSGNTNVVTYPFSENNKKRPFWLQTTNINNHPVVKFYGSNWFSIYFTSPIANWTEAEAFIVLKAQTNTLIDGPGLWRFGQGNSVYPYNTNLMVLDDFASTGFRQISNASVYVLNYHLYNPSSKPSEWIARYNGNLVLSNSVNAVGFYAGSPGLGLGVNSFNGERIEVLIYKQVLSLGQRSAVTEYMRRKHNLWP